MPLFFDIVLALPECIPQLDSLVTGARDDLSIVGAEADRENIGSVTKKTTSGQPSVKIPQAKCVIPGRRQGELTIGRNDNIGNKMVVPV